MNKLVKDLKSILSGVQIMGSVLGVTTITTIYLYIINKDLVTSIMIGIFTGIGSLYFVVYVMKRMEREQFLYKELQKYTTSMTFYLQSGYNVFNSLENSKKGLDKQIQNDIDKLKSNLVEFDTSHFEEYNFSSVNIFHEILKIKHREGGNAKELFTKVNQNVNFEIIKRDELVRRKKGLRDKVLMMMGIDLLFPILFVFLAKDLYEVYLEMGYLAIGLNLILFIAIIISLFFLQRNVTDISIAD